MTVKLWKQETRGTIWARSKDTLRSLQVAFSPDGKLLASGSEDMTVKPRYPMLAPCHPARTRLQRRIFSEEADFEYAGRLANSFHVLVSHSFTNPSPLPEASIWLSGEKDDTNDRSFAVGDGATEESYLSAALSSEVA